MYLFRPSVVLVAPPLHVSSSSLFFSLGFFLGGGFNRMTFSWAGRITSCVLCIAPPAPPPSGPPSTLTPGGSSTLSKKRPPPPPPGHKRTLSDPPSPLSHSPHSKGGLTGGETQAHVRTAELLETPIPSSARKRPGEGGVIVLHLNVPKDYE